MHAQEGQGEPATTLVPWLMKALRMTFKFSSYIMEKKAFQKSPRVGIGKNSTYKS